jgi:hypothetical protein
MQAGFAVTHSKQTTEAFSTRYKRPPPGGVPTWLPHRPTLCNSNRYAAQTGIAVTHTKQTTVVLSNRYAKPSPGECLRSQLFAEGRGFLSRAEPKDIRFVWRPVIRAPCSTEGRGFIPSVKRPGPSLPLALVHPRKLCVCLYSEREVTRQIRSTIVAMPWPTPMHMVQRA